MAPEPIPGPTTAVLPARAETSYPRPTPDSGCLDEIWSSYGAFNVGAFGGTCNLERVTYAATECPLSYTAVGTHEESVGPDNTFKYLTCCPDVYDFTYGPPYPPGETPTLTDTYYSTPSSCVAHSLNDTDESPPWTITFTEDFGILTADPTVTTTTFDPASDVLLAAPWTIDFQVSDGTTCAPDCEDPWQTDDGWPKSSSDDDEDDDTGSSRGFKSKHIAAIALPVAAVVLVVLCFLKKMHPNLGLAGRLKRKGPQEDGAVEQGVGKPGEGGGVAGESAGEASDGRRVT